MDDGSPTDRRPIDITIVLSNPMHWVRLCTGRDGYAQRDMYTRAAQQWHSTRIEGGLDTKHTLFEPPLPRADTHGSCADNARLESMGTCEHSEARE